MLAMRNSVRIGRCSSRRLSAGRMPRAISTSQRNSPTSSAICQNAPEVDVLVAAVAEVEPHRLGQHLLHAQPLARHRADHDEQERAEEHVDAGPLPLRLLAADRRRDVEARREPRGRDPEDAELHVPGARDRVRQDRRERDAVEAVALDAVVRRDDAHQDLHEDQAADGPEVLHDRALRRRRRRTQQRIVGGNLAERLLFLSRRVPPGHARRCRRAAR